jgi:hypothetical protein
MGTTGCSVNPFSSPESMISFVELFHVTMFEAAFEYVSVAVKAPTFAVPWTSRV